MGELAIQSEGTTPLSEAAPVASRRDRFNGWFVTHEVAWELAMAALAVVYVALGFAVDDLSAGERPEIGAAEWALTGIFVLEFGSRILAARSRTAYLRGPGSTSSPWRHRSEARWCFASCGCFDWFGRSPASIGRASTSRAWLDTRASPGC